MSCNQINSKFEILLSYTLHVKFILYSITIDANNVISTKTQRHDVESVLIQRCFSAVDRRDIV